MDKAVKSVAVPRWPATAEPVTTLANAVTLVRTVVAVALGVAAIAQGSLELVGIGYAVYWVGDIADGAVARLRGEETRHGAVFDILSDRACTSILAAGYLSIRPESAPALAVFLLQFMVLDCLLSLSFLHWEILGPNDFHAVDPVVYKLNWSPPAKALNTAAVIILLLAHLVWVAAALALVVAAVKAWSGRRVLRLLAERTPAELATVV
ncbi:CDP-alcohol phosphatidyltransferase family protein [Spongisporangium articulatum]|uniref:CDP-alcohol phosphatidyltransferase family protein n=1 Tax=Spongisporangium articulatum TaxID=3362603 RepID=A0ABW8AMX4_9ACTN